MLSTAPRPASADTAPDEVYAIQIRPLLKTHCLGCHSAETEEGGLDIEYFATMKRVRADLEPWQAMLDMLTSEEMPPEGEPEIHPDERSLLVGWIGELLDREAALRAGDPGPVLVRRLNNEEYRYTIGDLTGVDLQPTSQFPADVAAGEGFLNATDALAMSPALMDKYLDAAKGIAAHAVLLPDSFRFSTSKFKEDWVNEVLAEMLVAYARYTTETGEIPLDRYLTATIVHRDVLSRGQVSCREIAEAEHLSPKYLDRLWTILTEDHPSLIMDAIRTRWETARVADVPKLLDYIARWQSLVWRRQSPEGAHALDNRYLPAPVSLATNHIYRLDIPDEAPDEAPDESASDTPQAPIVLYLATQTFCGEDDGAGVTLRRPRLEPRAAPDDAVENEPSDDPPLALPLPLALCDALEPPAENAEIDATPSTNELLVDRSRFGFHPRGEPLEATDLHLESSEVLEVRLAHALAVGRTFVVEAQADSQNSTKTLIRFEVRRTATPIQIERGVEWQGREAPLDLPLLSSVVDQSALDGIAKLADEFRNLFPIRLCYPGVIVRDATVTLERFHRDDGFLSELMLGESETQHLDRLWKELHFVSRDALQVRDSLATLVQGEIAAYGRLQDEVHRRADETEQQWLDSEPDHITQLLDFAAHAYRRPLTDSEQQSLRDLYQSLRQDELPHDVAFRSVLARLLVSPNFLFRIEQSPQEKQAAPVNDWELASRLSYFLWSSLPDEPLRRVAADGRLREPSVWEQQMRRMLQDPRSRRLASEFGAQWLEVRNFDQFQGKDQELFPTFDAELREAIGEETILFFHDMFQEDGSLWQLIDADYTFLNKRLAMHYNIAGIEEEEFRRVDNVNMHGRGGMLGMASVLAKHSGASRTSPVLRGNWIAETLLGERLPRPPADVPQLPEKEGDLEMTIRQLVEQHADVEQCAVCHQRIDPFGFALEQYDTIGRWRDQDLGGRPVDAKAKLNNGTEFEGIDGLREYLLAHRKDDFLRQFCRKLLGFALGRRVLLSDRQLLEEMKVTMEANDGRVSSALLAIVSSKQFQYIRGSEWDP